MDKRKQGVSKECENKVYYERHPQMSHFLYDLFTVKCPYSFNSQ